ncbi:hypothetical protein ACH5RR_024138 [Cinchona calisaya]|uniref:BAG domain-containing protein n=1 Tax=Cinchona calisaya TaxID=153742 RepID=A0ABD2ZCN3_9GENT
MYYPVHQFMDSSYPHQMNQMPSTFHHHHYHHPRFEAIPGQMKADFERCPSYYQSWPSGGSYGYSYPAQCHGCCDRNYLPPVFCGQRPPYVHPPSPHYHGSCPVPPGPCPVQYIPPPNYKMEPLHYRSGYGHCCGCPNHTCNQAPAKNVKIEEEEEPDSGKKANDSVVPFDLKSHPYPVVWIPPGYMMNKANEKLNELQPTEKEKHSGAANTHEASKHLDQPQNFVNVWFPSDMENSRLTKQGGDSPRNQQSPDEGKGQVSFPLFWMPWNPDEMKMKDSTSTKTNLGEESVQGTPSRFEVTPVPVSDSEENTNTAKVNEETDSRECMKAVEKNNVQKTVPVKSAETTEEKKVPENSEDIVKSSLSKNVNSCEETKSSQTSGQSKSSSPKKSSKLPPICLRVDPLRKKNGNGSSRSPSPPGDKGKLQESSKDSAQPPTSSTRKEIPQQETIAGESVPEKTKNVEQSKRKVKTIEVIDGTNRQEGSEKLNISHPHGSSVSIDSPDADFARQTNAKSEVVFPDVAAGPAEVKNDIGTVQCQSIDSKCEMDEDKENTKVHESPADKTKGLEKIQLSDSEAALIIQSTYRGYEVRRWEPLKKLKQIANIREEVVELNNRIQALESGFDTHEGQDNDKLRTMLGENIMNLLLKLDTIQGLHPSIRDVRKYVASSLVSLQEKLDHLNLKKSESVHELSSDAKSEKDVQITDNPCFQGGEEEKASLESSPSKTENVHENNAEEICRDVAPMVMESASNPSCLEIPEVVRNQEDLSDGSEEPVTDLLHREDLGDGSEEPVSDLLWGKTSETSETGLLPETGTRDNSMNLGSNSGQEMIHPVVEGAASPVTDDVSDLKQLEELPKLQGEAVMENDVRVPELTELPQGMLDNVIEESGKHLILEQKDDKFVKDEMTTEDTNAELHDAVVLNVDQAELWQESTVNVPVTSESNGSLVCHGNVENDAEFCEEVNLGSHEIPVEALEEEKSSISEFGDASQMDDKAVSEIDGEILGSYKNDLDYCNEQIESELIVTPTEPVEVEEQVPQELAIVESSETENLSRKENEVSDPENSSSCEDVIAVSQECDVPTGDNKLFAQPSDSAACEENNVDEMESAVPLETTETDGQLPPPSSPTASQISLWSNASTEQEKKLVEENEKLREMIQKLIEAGKEQLTAISNLSGRVKDLEKKLSRKRKLKMGRHGTTRYASDSLCLRPSNDPLNQKPVSFTM